MQSGYYDAVGGMVTQFARLDSISNNLANVNTNSFKRDDLIVGDFLSVYDNVSKELPLANQTRDAARYLNHVINRTPVISDEYTNFSLGAIEQTNSPLDFALNKKNLFFALETPNGTRYTRDGSFSVSDDGYLVSKQGYRVLSRDGLNRGGGILVPLDSEIEVDANGNVRFRNPQNELILGGAIAVVSFANMRNLKKIGSDLYEIPDSKKDQIIPQETSLAFRQGALEKSNVNPVIEMANLIETNRLVDMYSKVLKTHNDDLNGEAISKLALRV